ncbi:fatty acid desaturase-domain-containing protein [Rhypophila decipiens]|uniref:Fatty acid desaturase-domain-containing protein n=1 Tax=Rhypophila decipiens TaxID=261697 RepID=A0AAN7B0N3_9PEZI|nr:fatty acid desaturase-domain-containing protein [Rhypophila decipiens]
MTTQTTSTTASGLSPTTDSRGMEARQSLPPPSRQSTEFTNLVDGYGKPFHVPDSFTVDDLRKAIPKECFERSAIHGLSYAARDLALIVTTFYIFQIYLDVDAIPSPYIRFALWSLYGFLNGLFGTGLWVLAHECGHQSFSTSKVLNDTVGFILHSSLLVPYFSWKISHGKHHKGTAHMERDMVFVPRTRAEHCERFGIPTKKLHEIVEDTPLYAAYYIATRLLFGWPTYLLTNDTGHDCHEGQPEGRGKGKKNGVFTGVNHFNPSSPLFSAKDAKLIFLSDLGILATATVLYTLGSQYVGWWNILKWYFVPYLWVNTWLVTITLLQHTDPSLPHYTSQTWTFVRGAASTIDRDFGFIGRHLFHGIIETHVLHHYVSTIPFYNAYKATEAIKPVMGHHYKADTAGGSVGFVKSLWRNVKWCRWVEPAAEAPEGVSRGVLFYRNQVGLGPVPEKVG